MLVFLWSFTGVTWNNSLVHTNGWSVLSQIAQSLVKPELSPDFLWVALEASWQTMAFAVAGLTLALLVGLPLGVLASGLVVSSMLVSNLLIVGVRLMLAVQRAIHELVWAWFFVVAIGLSPMAAVLALAVNYAGILGRIYAELLADVPEAPLLALRSTGASEVKVFFYGRLPMALPDMLSYTFYRLECGIRSSAIMSFVGIMGLGYQIELSLDDLRFREVWTLLFFLVFLVTTVDAWSSAVRRRLVG